MSTRPHKGKLFLIHWDAAEAEEKAVPLRADGWDVTLESDGGATAYLGIRKTNPDVIVIHLSRLPAHGSDTAHALRSTQVTRDIPIVFVGGQGQGLKEAKMAVPGAAYTSAADLPKVLERLFSGRGQRF